VRVLGRLVEPLRACGLLRLHVLALHVDVVLPVGRERRGRDGEYERGEQTKAPIANRFDELAAAIAVAGERPGRPAAYRFETIDVPGATATYVFGLNERGHMVGRIGSEETGDAWTASRKSRFVTFDFPGAPFTEAFDPDVQHGFIRDRRGRFTFFDAPGATMTQPFGMNDRGVVVGVSQGGEERGFVREPSGRVRVVDYPGADALAPLGVNNRGTFVGFFEDPSGRSRIPVERSR
jgi:hypothetical protein